MSEEKIQVVPGLTFGACEVLSLFEKQVKTKRGMVPKQCAQCLCKACGKEFARSVHEIRQAKSCGRFSTCKKCSHRGPFFKQSLVDRLVREK